MEKRKTQIVSLPTNVREQLRQLVFDPSRGRVGPFRIGKRPKGLYILNEIRAVGPTSFGSLAKLRTAFAEIEAGTDSRTVITDTAVSPEVAERAASTSEVQPEARKQSVHHFPLIALIAWAIVVALVSGALEILKTRKRDEISGSPSDAMAAPTSVGTAWPEPAPISKEAPPTGKSELVSGGAVVAVSTVSEPVAPSVRAIGETDAEELALGFGEPYPFSDWSRRNRGDGI